MDALTTMPAVATSREPTRDVSTPEASARPRMLRVKATYLLSEKGRKAAFAAIELERLDDESILLPEHRRV